MKRSNKKTVGDLYGLISRFRDSGEYIPPRQIIDAANVLEALNAGILKTNPARSLGLCLFTSGRSLERQESFIAEWLKAEPEEERGGEDDTKAGDAKKKSLKKRLIAGSLTLLPTLIGLWAYRTFKSAQISIVPPGSMPRLPTTLPPPPPPPPPPPTSIQSDYDPWPVSIVEVTQSTVPSEGIIALLYLLALIALFFITLLWMQKEEAKQLYVRRGPSPSEMKDAKWRKFLAQQLIWRESADLINTSRFMNYGDGDSYHDYLNIEKTIEATIAEGGFFTPVTLDMKLASKQFFFIQSYGAQDHWARAMEALVGKFIGRNPNAEIYYFRDDPRFYYLSTGSSAREPIEMLFRGYNNSHIIFLSKSEAFLDPYSYQMADWANRLSSHFNKALLDTNPAEDWGDVEKDLTEHGYAHFESTSTGLLDLAGMFRA